MGGGRDGEVLWGEREMGGEAKRGRERHGGVHSSLPSSIIRGL